ncbi:hypothetical protein BDK51DRAFT_34895 [Blyttiomyces helicus]|uniref:SH3 domain-containing protein n=1 Tax=Blyttiomyces helicus TaxID=388810 RepID=A0A4V1IRP9_9FUNG|nr:hypothetical protein BDK51DRAFT_34895 [Blyttiomyces helicus]|eukprot:RKO90817.1 hypothetical protein BDK51DRAFT_34895 [Blyttiomyces helicus]
MDYIISLAKPPIGLTGSGNFLNSLWRFSLTGPPSPTLINAAGPPSPRGQHCATNLGTDSILIYGGTIDVEQALSDQFIFNTTTGAWTSGPASASASLGRVVGAACNTVDGVPYLFGGADAKNALGGLWSYNAAAGVWTSKNSPGGPSPRVYASMTSVNSRWLVVSGGELEGIATDNSFYYYDLTTSRWSVNTTGISMLPMGSLPPFNSSNPPPSGTAPLNPTVPTVGSSSSSGSGSSTSAKITAGAAAGGIVVLIFVGWLFWHCTRNKRASKYSAPLTTAASPPAPGGAPSAQGDDPSQASALHPAFKSGLKLSAPPSPASEHHPDALATPHLGIAPAAVLPDSPPMYDGIVSGSRRNSINVGAASRPMVYRGLCTFVPSNEGQIPCKLGDQIIIRETFGEGWVRAINVSESK